MALVIPSKAKNATTRALTTRPVQRATFGAIPGEALEPSTVACPYIFVLRPSSCIDGGQYTDYSCFLQLLIFILLLLSCQNTHRVVDYAAWLPRRRSMHRTCAGTATRAGRRRGWTSWGSGGLCCSCASSCLGRSASRTCARACLALA